MKKFIIAIVLVVAVVIFYQSPYFNRVLSSSSQQNIKQTLDSVNPKMSRPVYKWQDKKGQWHMTDSPPADGTKYETLRYHKDTNVIPAERLKSVN